MAHVKDNGNQEEILDKLHGLPLKGFEEMFVPIAHTLDKASSADITQRRNSHIRYRIITHT